MIFFRRTRVARSPRAVTATQLDEIHRLRAALFDAWHTLPAGETLELTFALTP